MTLSDYGTVMSAQKLSYKHAGLRSMNFRILSVSGNLNNSSSKGLMDIRHTLSLLLETVTRNTFYERLLTETAHNYY